MSAGRATQPGNIVVTQGRIEALIAAFTRTWQRPPTASEREGLIRDYIREEVYVREAIALGLDQDDIVIRRRLRQKLEFVSEDVLAQAEPTDDQLRAYLTAHPDAFRVEPRFTFRQVFLNPQPPGRQALPRRRPTARAVATGRRPIPTRWAIPSLLDHRFEALPAGQVAEQFGDQFAATLASCRRANGAARSRPRMAPIWSWSTTARTAACRPWRRCAMLVRRDWANAQRAEASEKFYQALLRRYTVTDRAPQPLMATERTTQRRAMRPWLVVLALLLCAPVAFAHEVRPAYLQIHQTSADTYEVLWKVPGRGDGLRLGLYVELPTRLCKTRRAAVVIRQQRLHRTLEREVCRRIDRGHDPHCRSRCHDDGRARAPRAARRHDAGGAAHAIDAPSFVVEAAPTRIEVAGTYTRLGIEHILTGVDHLLVCPRDAVARHGLEACRGDHDRLHGDP